LLVATRSRRESAIPASASWRLENGKQVASRLWPRIHRQRLLFLGRGYKYQNVSPLRARFRPSELRRVRCLQEGVQNRGPSAVCLQRSKRRSPQYPHAAASSFGEKAVSGVDLGAEFFAQRVKRRSRNDALRSKPSNQLSELTGRSDNARMARSRLARSPIR
jgi:hypothetical protein